jgi:hypothetical protein
LKRETGNSKTEQDQFPLSNFQRMSAALNTDKPHGRVSSQRESSNDDAENEEPMGRRGCLFGLDISYATRAASGVPSK